MLFQKGIYGKKDGVLHWLHKFSHIGGVELWNKASALFVIFMTIYSSELFHQ